MKSEVIEKLALLNCEICKHACEDCRTRTARILDALQAEGMAVVPVKPTPDMMIAGLQSMTVSTYHNGYADHIWTAMLSASPYGKAKEESK